MPGAVPSTTCCVDLTLEVPRDQVVDGVVAESGDAEVQSAHLGEPTPVEDAGGPAAGWGTLGPWLDETALADGVVPW